MRDGAPERRVNPAVADAIATRKSARRFLDTPVPRRLIEEILTLAARAPSGTNMQPWRAYVVTGDAKARLEAALLEAHNTDPGGHESETVYYPTPLPEPYLARRRKVGWDLYGLLGITKGDREKTHAQHGRNYLFFDAPVGFIFTIDRVLEIGSWLDYGMFLENIMTAARGAGLHTCPQVAFAHYHKVIRNQLGIPDSEVVVCGMSMGEIDPDAPENTLVTEREPLEGFVRFLDA